MYSNADGYETEPVGTALEQAKRAVKKRSTIQRLPPSCPPTSLSSSNPIAFCDTPRIDAKSPSGHTHACTRIDERVLAMKLDTLRSLKKFDVVKNNEHLAQSLCTFETLVIQFCDLPTTPIAVTVVSQIDALHDAIYSLESICSAMSTLYLSQQNTRRRTNSERMSTFILCCGIALLVFAFTCFRANI